MALGAQPRQQGEQNGALHLGSPSREQARAGRSAATGVARRVLTLGVSRRFRPRRLQRSAQGRVIVVVPGRRSSSGDSGSASTSPVSSSSSTPPVSSMAPVSSSGAPVSSISSGSSIPTRVIRYAVAVGGDTIHGLGSGKDAVVRIVAVAIRFAEAVAVVIGSVSSSTEPSQSLSRPSMISVAPS